MKYLIIPLLLAQIACAIVPASIATTPRNGAQTAANAPATVQPTATPAPIVITASVWLRDYSGSKIGALVAGDTVPGRCAGDWCYLSNGKVWRGCTNHADGRGCEQQ